MPEKAIKRRILYCEGNIDGTIGGSYYSLLFLVSELDRTRYEPIVVFREDNELVSRFNDSGIRTLIRPVPAPITFDKFSKILPRLFGPIHPLLRMIRKASNLVRALLIEAIRCALLIQKERIDLVHLNNSISRNHEWMLGSIISRTICITHERGINPQFSRLTHFFARKIDGVICISQAVRDCLVKNDIRNQNVSVIYNGIEPSCMQDLDTCFDLRNTYGISATDHLIGVVGNIKQWKGQETIIRALPIILSEYPTTTCLLIGGISKTDLPYADHLKNLVCKLELQDHVVFTGFTNKVAEHMAGLDLVLHTSTEPEPFGRVLIEAMALEKPLIAAGAGAIPEIVKHEETGLIFEPRDIHELASRVISMIASPTRATEMGRAGYELLNQKFHIKYNVDRTQTFYDTLFSTHAKYRSSA